MADFNRNNKFSRDTGRGGFKRRDFNDRPPRGSVEMHKAICDECGNECQVPFRPTSGKPVFCSNCFEKNSSQSGRSQSQDWNPRRSSDEREMYEAVCDNCGKNCKIPFRPIGSRPVYCSDCFEKGDNDNRENRGSGNSHQPPQNSQIEELNTKLDRILELLTPKVAPKDVSVEIPVKEDSILEKKKKSFKKTELLVQ